jgi:hypothetical protein
MNRELLLWTVEERDDHGWRVCVQAGDGRRVMLCPEFMDADSAVACLGEAVEEILSRAALNYPIRLFKRD